MMNFNLVTRVFFVANMTTRLGSERLWRFAVKTVRAVRRSPVQRMSSGPYRVLTVATVSAFAGIGAYKALAQHPVASHQISNESNQKVTLSKILLNKTCCDLF